MEETTPQQKDTFSPGDIPTALGMRAWVIAVDMGYGHQRTAYPLKKFAQDSRVINANNYEGIPESDRKIWETSRKFYEFISNFKKLPLVGEMLFSLFDRFQRIIIFYPKRDLSRPNFSLRKIFNLIKQGWGKDLISKLREKSLPAKKDVDRGSIPFISTFFTPAFMAEAFNYPGPIFCVICDADISRAWVSLDPKKSKIKYFVPNSWVVERLKLYGVAAENIFLTGYPLPLENIGSENMEALKSDLSYRLLNLDPEKHYYQQYKSLVDKYLGGLLPAGPDHPLTIMFSVGGAGAQTEIVERFLRGLGRKIQDQQIRIILMAGTKEKVKSAFLKSVKKTGLKNNLEKNIEIVFAPDINEYFRIFNEKLRKTDILWTKPSELSFYSGLGVPLLLAPSIGSQEDFNRRWLLSFGGGLEQENPDYANQWVFDYLKSGRFAEAAMQGFVEAEKLGTYNIQKICFGIGAE